MSLYVGAISGTSIDGLDLAILEVAERPTILHSKTVPLNRNLQFKLEKLTGLVIVPSRSWWATPKPKLSDLELTGQAHIEFGRFVGRRINEFLKETGIPKDSIRAIGSHGQTVCHHPELRIPFSLQIGDGSTIAERTGIPCICDFRSRDIAAGGEGAPLVPVFHEAIFGGNDLTNVVLNIGGIANITVVPKDGQSTVIGYDTGPGNALLDAWIRYKKEETFDKDGNWSTSGTVNQGLLMDYLSDPYFAREPPKSTGKEWFNLRFVIEWLDKYPNISDEDVQATLLELTCKTIADQIVDENADQVIVCGGGRLNTAIMSRLQDLLSPAKVVSCDSLNIDGDGLEAAAFAYLAHCLLEGKPGNIAAATGAKGPRLLGCIYPATRALW